MRIYRVVLEPGQTSGLQTRGLSGLRVAVSGGEIAIERRGEKMRKEKTRAGEFQWVTGNREYTIKNLGRARYEAIEIEWK